ncbi:MAG: chromate transporter, partial [Betaproteobacteria bacterium]
MSLQLVTADWLALLGHFLSLSLLAVGGAISTAPEMHRYLVTQQQWLTEAQFSSSIALAQAAPGPNVLFIALLGWQVGLNAAAGSGLPLWASAMLGVSLTMLGTLLPSTILTFSVARWGHRNRERRAVRAFKQGMAPLVVGILLATGVILATNQGTSADHWPLWLLAAVSALLVWRTRIHLLWLLGAGAVLGGLGWV